MLFFPKGTDSVDGRNEDVIMEYHMVVRQLYVHALTNSMHSCVCFQFHVYTRFAVN